jgi:DNA repair protein RecO (recombination protein O)
VRATWKARLSEHLGNFTCELMAADAARLLDDPARLAALTAACALSEAALPEREPHPGAFDGLAALIEALPGAGFAAAYVRWELALLTELGFGLDLGRCAATGVAEGLTFVSPRSGRAVSQTAAEPYRDRLLKLPRFLVADAEPGPEELMDGLRLTGHFLNEHAFAARPAGMPAARARLVERLGRAR